MAKVLVLDDEANLRKVLAALLRREGYDVTVAVDGEQGLAEFHKNGADIVVTDLVMPKVGGMEVLSAVKSANSDVPVIIITAHDDPETRHKAEMAGCAGYFRKNDSGEDILAAIRRLSA